MARRKCSAKQLAALKRGREKLRHKRNNKRTNGNWDRLKQALNNARPLISSMASFTQNAFNLAGKMGDQDAQKRADRLGFVRGLVGV